LSTKRRQSLPFSYGRGTERQEFSRAGPWSDRTSPPFYSPSTLRADLTAPGLVGTQVTESENHPLWRKVSLGIPLSLEEASQGGDPLANIGGDFTMTKTSVIAPSYSAPFHWTSPWNLQNPAYRWVFHGPLVMPGYLSIVFPPAGRSSETELINYGTKAIANCAPTNSVVDLSTAILEVLREGLPNLVGSLFWKDRARSIKDVSLSDEVDAVKHPSSEFLNVEFGWLPLINDVTKFAQGVAELSKRVEQLVKDSGKQVRRRYDFPPVDTSDVTVWRENVSPGMYPDASLFYDPLKVNKGRVTRNRLTTVRRWFTGAFTYHIPPEWGDAMAGHGALARHLLGTSLTPEILWNLAPWSWAADWFTNAGDVLHNASEMSSELGLIIRYGYIMEHSIVRDVYVFEGETGFLPGYSGRPATLVLQTEVKLRRKATPFGFGLSTGLTSRQAAIVAALGASRV